MLKKIVLAIGITLVVVYLGVSMMLLNRHPGEAFCERVKLTTQGDTSIHYITNKGVEELLRKNKLFPVGLPMNQVNSGAIEHALEKHPLVADVEVYKTAARSVHIHVVQRVPILRVMNTRGENFYIDQKGGIVTARLKSVYNLPIVTGHVEKSSASRILYQFGLFLQDNAFWNAQIEQIHVNTDQTVELVPRVGNHIVYMGTIDHFEQKLNRLRKFYEKGLNEVGWNKYSKINIEFENQIICTKH